MTVREKKTIQVRANKSLKEYAAKRDFDRTPEPVASGNGGDDQNRSGGTSTAIETPSCASSDRHPPDPSGKDTLGRGGNHQTRAGRILHRHRRLDSPTYRWPSIGSAAVPLGHGSQLLFRQASVARFGRQGPPRRYRRQRADGRGR